MKKLQKLELKKTDISVLGKDELSSVNGALFKSRALCFGTNPGTNCTQHTRCSKGSEGYQNEEQVTIFCID